MSPRAIQLSIVIGILIVLLGTVGPGAAYAETESRCFAETNFCLAGRLREF